MSSAFVHFQKGMQAGSQIKGGGHVWTSQQNEFLDKPLKEAAKALSGQKRPPLNQVPKAGKLPLPKEHRGLWFPGMCPPWLPAEACGGHSAPVQQSETHKTTARAEQTLCRPIMAAWNYFGALEVGLA